MKKLQYIVLGVAIATMPLLTGCRESGDVYFDPSDPINLNYYTYTDQFEAIWQGLNTHYVFWSIDPTDWDAVYSDMKPKFAALDSAYNATGAVADSVEYMRLFTQMTSTLIDHHMNISWRDVHTQKPYNYYPGLAEVQQRDYFRGDDHSTKKMADAVKSYADAGLLDGGKWGEWNEHANFFGTLTLDNGKKIAYLWQNGYYMTPVLDAVPTNDMEAQYIKNIDRWMKLCTTDSLLAGIILDNRNNLGGLMSDLNYVVGAFIDKPMKYADMRYKEGPGRYEYTEWFEAHVDTCPRYPQRDLQAEGIPYIALVNAASISMGELSSSAIRLLPTGSIIGERTFGAHGPIINFPSFFHDGSFGNKEGKHYVYTSSVQMNLVGGGILEGTGITPDEIYTQRDYGLNKAMEVAIQKIKDAQLK